MAEDLLFVKAREFTDTETDTMVEWLLAALEAINQRSLDLGAKARAILDTGLMAEHYRSLLSEVAGQITPEQAATLADLFRQFNDAKAAFFAEAPVERVIPDGDDGFPVENR